MEFVTIYPAIETVVSPEQLADGIEAMEKEAKVYEKTLRSQKKIEEASRIRAVIREFSEELKEGWKVSGLDAYVRYFCKETVSFLDYFKKGLLDGGCTSFPG